MHTYKTDQIDNAIVAIERDSGKLQDKIHAVGFAVARAYAFKEMDANWTAERLTALQGASPYHADAFSKWVAKFFDGFMVWNKEQGTWVAHDKNFPNREQAETLLAEAKAMPFFKLKPAKAPKPYNDLEAFLKFAENLEAKNKKAAKSEGDITVHPGFVTEVRKLAQKAQELKAAG